MIPRNLMNRTRWACAVGLLLVGAIVEVGCDGVVPPNGGGGSGDGNATIRGTVTNDATDSALAGAKVIIGDSAEVTTDDAGAYTADVPAGVYTVTFENDFFMPVERSVAVNGGESVTVNAALTPSQAVKIVTSMEGSAEPGESITIAAAVEVLDGSTTVQGFSWAQSNSVDVSIAGGSTDTATVTLPDAAAYKAELMKVLREPPITADQLPENVPLPDSEEFPGGLPDRFQVVGPNPFAIEETGHVALTLTVETSSGDITEHVDIHTELPWRPAPGIRNVPIEVPVLLSGKMQDSYDWAMSTPPGSSTSLIDATTREPYFTPDVAGLYRVTVTNMTGEMDEDVVMEIRAGTWEGVITGQDADGLPVAANCTICHNDGIARDLFTPWARTGHATIFSDSIDTNDHYGEQCFVCHTVGYDLRANNGGVDEVEDFEDFLAAGLLANPGDNWDQVVDEFPATAQMANVQCESCHGPQRGGGAHTQGEPRLSLSSNVCATCHGEPLRHARFQQWQLSGHANYELAIDEGENGNCARCHTANGFLAWLPILLDDDPNTDPLDNIEITWTADETEPQTCVVCHDPHNIGTVSGSETNATVRISGDTPPLIAGFQVFGAGRGALCMTCHNSRRGLRNDDNFDEFAMTSEAGRAPHGSAQADVLMGENAFLVEVGIRGAHSFVEDTCVACHMVETPPPDVLSYNLGGTNHTFFASKNVCASCHTEIPTSDNIEIAFNATSDQLKLLVEEAILNLISEQELLGNSIDLGGEATLTDETPISNIDFGSYHGQQAITVTLTDSTVIGPVTMSSVMVFGPGNVELGRLYDFADARLIKAGWNWNLGNNDGSKAAHNPSFVFGFLDASIDALNELKSE